jgi:transcriptional regulator NrdR family protein
MDVQQTFTRAEVVAYEDYMIAKLNKERSEKEQAQKLVKSLTEQLKKKNEEIEHLDYFITSLTLSLKLSSDYVMKLRKQLKKIE